MQNKRDYKPIGTAREKKKFEKSDNDLKAILRYNWIADPLYSSRSSKKGLADAQRVPLSLDQSKDTLNTTTYPLTTKKIREVISKYDRRSYVKTKHYETSKLLSRRSEYRNMSKNNSISRSVGMKNKFSPHKSVALNKGGNDYGLNNLKSHFLPTRSFNDTSNHLSSIKDEMTMLNEEEIARYMSMLSRYIEEKQDNKVVTTLKILLTHFTRKQQQTAKKVTSQIDQKEKEKLVNLINSKHTSPLSVR